MPDHKGFSLIEIIVVMVILAVLTVLAMPPMTNMMVQGESKAAEDNLINIYNGQKTFYLNNAYYCTTTSAPITCASQATLFTNLNLQITDNNFAYACTAATGFTCTATNNLYGGLILTLTNKNIVLPGSASALNPSCSIAFPAYCPN